MKLFKNPSKADLKEVDLSVNAQVQRLKVTVIFRFLDRVKVSEQRVRVRVYVCVCVRVQVSPPKGNRRSPCHSLIPFDVVDGMYRML